MSGFLIGAVAALLGLFALSLIRVWIGPTQADRILAVQLAGTTTVAVLLLLSAALEVPALRIVALLFVLFAALVAVAFVRHPARRRG